MALHTSVPDLQLFPATTTLDPDDGLHIASWSLNELAAQYGTPLYIFDQETIINACNDYQRAFNTHYSASPVRILYAAKAYLAPYLARLLAQQGLGLDIVSGGEMLVAQQGSFPMERVSFHGNNKSDEELRLALQLGVGRIVLDNWSELERLTRIARELQIRPQVLLRVAPAVETDTHHYLQTGHASAKFGFHLQSGDAKAALLRILQDGYLQLCGLHAHSGTLLRETRPYEECIERLLVLASEIQQETGWWPEEVSPGGGWGIDTPDAGNMPGIEILAAALQRTVERLQPGLPGPVPTLVIEPGRSIIARAGIALYRVGAIKETPGGITYLFVDGGMADNIRPALYGASYSACSVAQPVAPVTRTYCIAGRYCESGDLLIERAQLPEMQEEELVCLPLAGAYCLPMASNYNLVPRPAVLIVNKHEVVVMERRETNQDILRRYGPLP